jgi:hypothetical protein
VIGFFRKPAASTATGPSDVRVRDASQAAADYYRYALAAAVLLGIVVRLFQILRTDFPLNDGGLFYTMVRDLQQNNFALPSFTSYNASNIPFAYPPLALYITAVLDRITPFGLPFWFRALPLLFTCLTLVAFVQLARTVLTSHVAVVVSVIAFALIPRSFLWLLMGGGLTRALGMAFAIFALQQVYLLYTKEDRRYLIPAILLAGGTVLSHLETGWFLAFSIALFWAVKGSTMAGVKNSILLAGGTLLVTAPWWGTVIAQHGIGQFLDANSTGGTFFSIRANRDLAFQSIARAVATSEPYFPVIGALGLLGGFACLASRRFLLPAWWLAIILLDVRAFATYASVPVALLAGVALAEAIIPLLKRLRAEDDDAADAAALEAASAGTRPAPRSTAPFGLAWGGLAVLACLLYYSTAVVFVTNPGAAEASSLTSLTPDERAAFNWVETSTPAASRFLVIPRNAWQTDKESEWFPTLTHRVSVATVQGTEWLPSDAFSRRIGIHNYAAVCAGQKADCLDDWSSNTGTTFDYVYLPTMVGNPCCGILLGSLEDSPEYEKVYNGAGAIIFKHLPAPVYGPTG